MEGRNERRDSHPPRAPCYGAPMSEDPTSLILEHLKAIRAEQSQHRTLLLHHGELLRRVERRIAEVERRIEETKDDLRPTAPTMVMRIH